MSRPTSKVSTLVGLPAAAAAHASAFSFNECVNRQANGLQEMGGWKSAEMVRRYAHLAPAQAERNAAAIDALLQVTTSLRYYLQGQQKRATEHRNPLI
jgi:hypothetical protein